MLSTVALYHGELSNTSVSSANTPMQERLAAMRISSASGKWLLYYCRLTNNLHFNFCVNIVHFWALYLVLLYVQVP